MTFSIEDTVHRLRIVLRGRGVAPDDIDDVIQEAFQRLEVYRQTHEVQRPEGFLVRTSVNLAVDIIRRNKRAAVVSEPVEALDIRDDRALPDEVYMARRRLERLNEGFAAMDAITRHMLRAQRVENLSVAEIAKRHGVSISAVEKRLSKGVLFLVKWMDGW